ncbi:hypothetical protein K435DRAFT_584237, partial [Dendrothele bispora CBS 962.96]
TPSKRMRILTSNLSATSSGSFLTSKTPYGSSTPFPRLLSHSSHEVTEPDWSLIHTSSDSRQYLGKESMARKINRLVEALRQAKLVVDGLRENEEIYMAQSVLQDMTLVKMNKTIRAREEEKAAKQNRENLALPGPGEGYGRIWSTQEILDYKRKKREEEERDEMEKEKRRNDKKDIAEKKKAIELEWKKILAEHQTAVESWETVCQKLKDEGIKKKDWPRKPSHISKKELTSQ